MRFSQRIGMTEPAKIIQLESIDNELRNGLWNIILIFLSNLEKHSKYHTPEIELFANNTWHNHFKLPTDTVPRLPHEIIGFIRKRFFSDKWFEAYDFIEFLMHVDLNVDPKGMANALNHILEREFSGYRIMDKRVIPISNSLEFEQISKATSNTSELTALIGANLHLDNALKLISDKKNPSYSNSIKESISAVEATCRIITDENTLGKALNKLQDKGLYINPQFKSGMEKIYAYSNDKKNGIRHAIVEQPNETHFEDAKFMLVLCSSFINYLVGKYQKIGLNKIE